MRIVVIGFKEAPGCDFQVPVKPWRDDSSSSIHQSGCHKVVSSAPGPPLKVVEEIKIEINDGLPDYGSTAWHLFCACSSTNELRVH